MSKCVSSKDFDLDGVSMHLISEDLLDAFRKTVTNSNVRPHLTLENQAPLAGLIVDKSSERGVKLTAKFIKNFITDEIYFIKSKGRKIAFKAESERKASRTDVQKMMESQAKFVRDLEMLKTSGFKIAKIPKTSSTDTLMGLAANWRVKASMRTLLELAKRLDEAGLA